MILQKAVWWLFTNFFVCDKEGMDYLPVHGTYFQGFVTQQNPFWSPIKISNGRKIQKAEVGEQLFS